MGREMLEHGYTTRHSMWIDYNKTKNEFEFGRTADGIDLDNFPWDDYNTKYSDWVKEPCLDGKSGEEVLGTKGQFGELYFYYSYITINNDGTISKGYDYDFEYTGDTIIGKSQVYGGKDIVFQYEESTGEFYYDGVNGKIYLDTTLPFFLNYQSDRADFSYVYDENCRLLEEEYSGVRREVYKYENGKLVEIKRYVYNGLQSTTIYYYNDLGLLFGEITISRDTNSITRIIAYDYK